MDEKLTEQVGKLAEKVERLNSTLGKVANVVTGLSLKNYMDSKNNAWPEILRLITPFLVLALGGLGWAMSRQLSVIDLHLSDIDNKMFTHLTNSEVHIPRATVISKDEFQLYQNMRDKQMGDIKDSLCRLEGMVQKHMDSSKR